jgi:hypothetical protein
MSAITTLVENSIIDDLLNDDYIAQFSVVPHDQSTAKDTTDIVVGPAHFVVIVVTAYDYGDFVGTFGAGIRNIHVEVAIDVSITEPDYGDVLDTLVDKIAQRLQPSTTLPGVQNRDFSTVDLKVYGILDQNVRDQRNDLDRDGTRQRIIERTFVAVQLN